MEEEEGGGHRGELHDAYKEMSRAVGVKMAQGAQKAKALWKMKAAEDAGEEFCDPVREDKQHRGEKRDTISTLGRAPQRSDCGTG